MANMICSPLTGHKFVLPVTPDVCNPS